MAKKAEKMNRVEKKEAIKEIEKATKSMKTYKPEKEVAMKIVALQEIVNKATADRDLFLQGLALGHGMKTAGFDFSTMTFTEK